MMASVPELLVNSLDELKKEELDRFQWLLKHDAHIPASKLEKASVIDTVDKIVEYHPKEAVNITVNILRRMKHNHQAEQLENKLKEVLNAPVDVAVSDAGNGVNLLSDKQKSPPYQLNTLSDDGGQCAAGLHQYACKLTLDPNTANIYLSLSEESRKVTHGIKEQSYPDHPERFDEHLQVLCRESLTGRCYWEAEWSGWAHVAVSYKGIKRKGDGVHCRFGLNEKSWSLIRLDHKLIVCHNNEKTFISVPSPPSNRVGVYLDCPAGTLSFYSVSDTQTLTHLHRFNTTFTEPLYAGFGFDYFGSSDSSVSLCQIE